MRTSAAVIVSVSPAGTSVISRPPAGLGLRQWVRRGLLLVCVAIMCLAAAVQSHQLFRSAVISTTPGGRNLDIDATLFPVTDVTVLVSAGNEFATWQTTAREVVSSPVLWRRMHLMQWNLVPDPLRAHALENMLSQYRALLTSPRLWDRMTVSDWDAVPQPIRTVAYRHMLDYWAGFYGVGIEYDLPPRVVADTLAAIVMSESWFDHRADVVGVRGNRDLGLGQASDYARVRLRELYAAGVVDAELSDEDYVNPWKGTRFVALWMQLLLDEARGDLDTAIRAYHRGISGAHDRLGTAYLQTVRRRLSRYIRNHDAPAGWDYVWTRARDMVREDWPWVAPGRGPWIVPVDTFTIAELPGPARREPPHGSVSSRPGRRQDQRRRPAATLVRPS